MMPALFLAVLAALPSPAPLKTISHVHASRFCTALREHIAPAVRALIENKPVVTQGKNVLLDMARDQVYGTGHHIDLYMTRLNDLITPLAANLLITNAELAKIDGEITHESGDERRRLIEIHKQLEAVAQEQNQMLNVFSGTYNSFTSNQLLAAGNPVQAAIKPTASSKQSAAIPVVADAMPAPASSTVPLPTPAPRDVAPPAAPAVRTVDMGLIGDTVFVGLFNQLTTMQLHELSSEARASRSITDAASQCK